MPDEHGTTGMPEQQDTAGTPGEPVQASVEATGAPPPAEFAGRGTRLGAVVLDGLLWLAAYVLLFLMKFSTIVGILGVLAFIALAVVQIYLLTKVGQTIGKRWLDIRIVKVSTAENGGFVPNVLLRVVVNSILSAVPIYALVDALFIFREDRRCIHDLIAGTRVIPA